MDMATQSTVPPAFEGTEDTPKRRRRRIIRNTLLGILGAIFAVWLILFITKGRFLKHPFESIVGRMTSRAVTVRGDFQLYFAPLRIKFVAEGITVSNPGWASRPNLFSADRIDARIAPLSLIFGKRRLLLARPAQRRGRPGVDARPQHQQLDVQRQEGRQAARPARASTSRRSAARRYAISTRGCASSPISRSTTSARPTRGSARPSGSGAPGALRDTPFRVVARLLSPDATVNRRQNKLVARAWAANNVVDVSGTLPSIADVENVPPADPRAGPRHVRTARHHRRRHPADPHLPGPRPAGEDRARSIASPG